MLTPEGYYVKDLRIFKPEQFKISDIVIVDNSVYSFAFHIDNGIPIIPFYDDRTDEEMLHLVYYLNCLATVADVREQNRTAFELFKLSNGQMLEESIFDQAEDLIPPTSVIDEGSQLPEIEEEEEDEFASNAKVCQTFRNLLGEPEVSQFEDDQKKAYRPEYQNLLSSSNDNDFTLGNQDTSQNKSILKNGSSKTEIKL